MAAREISAIKPTLDQNNVKLIGVGLEELGVQEFIDGKFFDGELYIDSKKQSYNDLGFERFGFLGLFPAILSSLSRAAQGRAKALGLGGNMAGDGYQNGGAIVVEKGGEQTLLHYKQKEAADHVSNSEVLKVSDLKYLNAYTCELILHLAYNSSVIIYRLWESHSIRTMYLLPKLDPKLLELFNSRYTQ